MKIISTLRIGEDIQQKFKGKLSSEDLSFYQNIKEAELELEEAEVLLTYGEDITPLHIEKAKNLKWIMVMSAGVEKLPFKLINERGILVTNARGIHKTPMAEYTLGMILQYTKKLKVLYDQEKEGKWDRAVAASISELNDKTVLILGVGAIGGQIAKLCKAFGMTVIGVNRSGEAVDSVDKLTTMEEFSRFLPKADFIISVLPSTEETKGLLKREHFENMKKSAVFINIGRGSVIRESELLEIMNEQLISHSILDVFEKEPLNKEHPFWKMDNITITPHLSSITSNYLPRAFDIFEQNLHIYKNGQKNFINMIDVKRGY
ncbi:D-2-hydroxyacid dehydrogenase [Bacillus sp. AK128]